MQRYQVTRKSVRFKRQTFNEGEYLPETFSARDLWQVMYPSRVSLVEIPDAPQEKIELGVPVKGSNEAAKAVQETAKAVSSVSGTTTKSATTKATSTTQKKTLASQPKNNGTLSGTK